MKKCKKITIYFIGDFYGTDFWGYNSLKELMADNNIKRKTIREWIKVY